ncbi:hypothetical protein MMC18_003817 [Xylographa bjoerkii]|nr:hypothetical protein [Xylographa bjoerkii]
MPSVKYFLNRQLNGFYSGSVLEGVDEKGDSTVPKKYRGSGYEKREDGDVVQADKQSNYPVITTSDTSRQTGQSTPLPQSQNHENSKSSVLEKDSAPPTSTSRDGSDAVDTELIESVAHHLAARNLGEQLRALHISTSKESRLAAHHTMTQHTTGDSPSDERSSDSFPNSHILVLRYELENTNITTREWPTLVDPQIFAAFGISTSSSINHLIRVLDFMSVVACEEDRPRQLIIWSKDSHNELTPGSILALEPKNETRTLNDLGWRGGVASPVRVSLLGRPYSLKFLKDVGM